MTAPVQKHDLTAGPIARTLVLFSLPIRGQADTTGLNPPVVPAQGGAPGAR